MPNHCSTSLRLDGELKHRQEFVDKNKGFDWGDKQKKGTYKDLSFNAQVPLPKRLVHPPKKSKDDGWYDWCLKNWGTKWDCYEEHLTHGTDYTCYSFDTAWSPPSEWIQKVSRKFPHLKFNVTWAEEGGEGGKFMFHGGDCFYSANMTEEEWKEYQGIEGDEDW